MTLKRVLGGQEPAGRSAAQQGGLGMQALPRPPPLTIPFDGSVRDGSLGNMGGE